MKWTCSMNHLCEYWPNCVLSSTTFIQKKNDKKRKTQTINKRGLAIVNIKMSNDANLLLFPKIMECSYVSCYWWVPCKTLNTNKIQLFGLFLISGLSVCRLRCKFDFVLFFFVFLFSIVCHLHCVWIRLGILRCHTESILFTFHLVFT